MPIRLKCPNAACQKVLNVKDHMAGKKAACPACKKMLTIPDVAPTPAHAPGVPGPATPEGTNNGTTDLGGHEAEHLAASLLSDEDKAAAASAPIKLLKFTCEYCDEAIQLDVELAGKRAPCPSCKRILKVPKPEADAKADWRNPQPGLPSAARRPDQEAPEGTWSSTARTGVSRTSLQEAGVLPDKRARKVTLKDWAIRGLVSAAGVVVVVFGVLTLLDWLGGKRQEKLLNQALQATSANGALNNEQGAIIHLAAARYHLRREEENRIKPEKGDAGAWNQFGLARARLRQSAERNPECQAMLIQLATEQVGLGGSAAQVEAGKALSWPDTIKEIRQTLQIIQTADARAEGLRQVFAQLASVNQQDLAEDLAAQLGQTDDLAVVGLEYFRKGDAARAAQCLERLLPLITVAKPAPGVTPPPIPLTPNIVALVLLLKNEAALPPIKTPEQKQAAESGRLLAQAWKGGGDLATQLAALAPDARLEGWLAVASAPGDNARGKSAAEAAAQMFETDPKFTANAWRLVYLVRLGSELGLEADRLLNLVSKIGDKDRQDRVLRGWGQLPVLRKKVSNEGGSLDLAPAELIDSSTLAHGLLRVEIAEQATLRDTSAVKSIEGWEDKVRPFGQVGAALGLLARK